MNRLRSVALLLAAVALASCEKTAVQDITGPLPASRVKFFNFGVNAPSVNFYANDAKITAISSSTGVESTLGVGYGSVGSGGFYNGIAPGQTTLTGRISATTDKDLVISSASTTIVSGMAYSYYQSGFYDAATKKVDAFVVEDAVPAVVNFETAHVRFVNAISNSSPMTLFARHSVTLVEVPIGGSVAYKSAGAFTAIPAGVYDLAARTAGATTNAISRTGVSFSGGRVYTIGARGDITVTSTTATTRPFLDNTANR